jgi:hypothetical protein
MTAIDPAGALREGFSGQVLAPEQPGYDEARRVFNAMFDRRPAVIARCASTADVIKAVGVAREHGLITAVRGGGHSFAGLSTCDDGIVIDLGGLKADAVDPQAQIAKVGGGVLWGELDAATQAHGLQTPGVLAGLALFGIDDAREVIRGWRDVADVAPDELASACVLITAPAQEFVPPELQGQPVVVVAGMYVRDPDTGAAVMQPLKDLRPTVDLIAPMPYTAFQASLDATAPWGLPFYARGEYVRELPDAAIDTFLQRGIELIRGTHPLSQMILFRIGQGIRAVSDEASAFSHRDAAYLLHPIVAWNEPADAELTIAAARSFAIDMRPDSTGVIPELHNRGRPRPRGPRRSDVRPPRRAHGHLRPRKPVQAQPKHPTEPPCR